MVHGQQVEKDKWYSLLLVLYAVTVIAACLTVIYKALEEHLWENIVAAVAVILTWTGMSVYIFRTHKKIKKLEAETEELLKKRSAIKKTKH